MIVTFTTIFGSGLAPHTITEEFPKRAIKQLLIYPRKRLTVVLSSSCFTYCFKCIVSRTGIYFLRLSDEIKTN